MGHCTYFPFFLGIHVNIFWFSLYKCILCSLLYVWIESELGEFWGVSPVNNKGEDSSEIELLVWSPPRKESYQKKNGCGKCQSCSDKFWQPPYWVLEQILPLAECFAGHKWQCLIVFSCSLVKHWWRKSWPQCKYVIGHGDTTAGGY